MTETTTETTKKDANGKLAVIFAKINMSELPAMSIHVQELISLSYSSRSAAYDLSKVILKDYSLTNKVLQVVNSAYYSVGHSISSISKAVTILGFDAVRNVAAAIALFEDFLKSGVEKEGISKLLTRSFLGALQARDIAISRNLNVLPEEAFICGLLHTLGKIITCIYLPGIYKEIEKQVAQGVPEDTAARTLLEDITYTALGEEVAKFWNLSPKIVAAMDTKPMMPKNSDDSEGYLRILADFSNRFVASVCDGEELEPLFGKYGKALTVDKKQAIEILLKGVEESEDLSDSLRYGLSKLNMRGMIENAGKSKITEKAKARPDEARRVASSELLSPSEEKVRIIVEDTTPGGSNRQPLMVIEDLEELPSTEKSINDFVREMTETMMGEFKLDEFYVNLLEAIYRGIGFDRVILAIVSSTDNKIALVGRYGLGEIDPANIANFHHSLINPEQAITRSLQECKDMAIRPNAPGAFPENFHHLVKDRAVYLFPICIDKKPIGMLYMDRKGNRPKLDKNQIKAARLFRDFSVLAIQKLRSRKKSEKKKKKH